MNGSEILRLVDALHRDKNIDPEMFALFCTELQNSISIINSNLLDLESNNNNTLSAPMPLQKFLALGISISGRLNEIHQKDLIHADIRPDNISGKRHGHPCL